MAITMVPDAAARPEVFPTERLMDNGMARPELRQGLRRIANVRNAITVARCGLGAVLIGGAVWIATAVAYLVAFILMGPMYARFAILMHEAAHKLLFTNKRVNDWVGTWLHRLSDLDAHLASTGGATSPTTKRSSGRASRTSPSTAATGATGGPWPGGWSGTPWASRVGRTSRRCSRR